MTDPLSDLEAKARAVALDDEMGPVSARSRLNFAMQPEVVLKLVEIAKAAMLILHKRDLQWADTIENRNGREAALRRALAALSDGG